MKVPKIAIYYDWLNQYGGAEKVLLDILALYPDAPLFTLVYDPKKTSWLPKTVKVVPSFLNSLPLSKNNPIFYTPLYSHALEKFDLSAYDIIISTTSTVGHCLLSSPRQLYVCYFHNANRYLYQTPSTYRPLKPLLKPYQKIDRLYSLRPDYFFCNSSTVKNRILNAYGRDAEIINPGVDVNLFTPAANSTNSYYLVVSRLVKHKNIDLAIKACAKGNFSLIIVGKGREKKKLLSLVKTLKTPRVQFLDSLSPQKLVNLYQNCKAVICPQNEDFGLVQIEAQACGKPVIGFNKGGNTETVIDGKTGYLFNNQTAEDLFYTLKKFEDNPLSSRDCRTNALRFSQKSFMLHFKQAIDLLWAKFQKTIT